MTRCVCVCVSVSVSAVRTERRHVREVEVERWLRATPSKSKASSYLFRNLRDNGKSHIHALLLTCFTISLALLHRVNRQDLVCKD